MMDRTNMNPTRLTSMKRFEVAHEAILSRFSRQALLVLVLALFVLVLDNARAWGQPEEDAPPPAPDMMQRPERGPERGPEGMGPRAERFRRRMEGRMGEQREHPAGEGEGHGRMGRLRRFLQFVEHYHNAVSDPQSAIGLAALGIKDGYRQQGKPLEAVAELEEILNSTNDRKARNILLFTMRQIYEEAQDTDKLLAINKRIVKENIDALK